MFISKGLNEGARSLTGKIQGSYLHGLFANDDYRRWWLNQIRVSESSPYEYTEYVDNALDKLADGVSQYCDVPSLMDIAQPVGWSPDENVAD